MLKLINWGIVNWVIFSGFGFGKLGHFGSYPYESAQIRMHLRLAERSECLFRFW